MVDVDNVIANLQFIQEPLAAHGGPQACGSLRPLPTEDLGIRKHEQARLLAVQTFRQGERHDASTARWRRRWKRGVHGGSEIVFQENLGHALHLGRCQDDAHPLLAEALNAFGQPPRTARVDGQHVKSVTFAVSLVAHVQHGVRARLLLNCSGGMVGLRPVGGELAARNQSTFPFSGLRLQGVGNVLQVLCVFRQHQAVRQEVEQVVIEKGHGVERGVLEVYALFQEAKMALPLFAHFPPQAAVVEPTDGGSEFGAAPGGYFVGGEDSE